MHHITFITATTDPLLCGHVNLAILMDTSESLTDNLDHSKSSILGILDLLKSDTVNVRRYRVELNPTGLYFRGGFH